MQSFPARGEKVFRIEAGLETPAISLVRGFLKEKGATAWLTGGTLRDILSERRPYDVDLVTREDPVALARSFADSIGGSFFILSERFMACRVVDTGRVLRDGDAPAAQAAPAGGAARAAAGGPGRQEPPRPATFDFAALRGSSIEDDLRQRDFTVNAMALELPGGGGLTDPLGGLRHLEERSLAAVSDSIFRDDPLRLLRAVRLEKTAGLRIAAPLDSLIRRQAALAAGPAPERTFAELAVLLDLPGPAAAVRRLDGLGLLEVLLPEMTALKGVVQNEYHHLDVFEHTLANCEAMEHLISAPEEFFPAQAQRLRERAGRRLAGDAGWSLVMVLASLLHDIAKPECRFLDDDGQYRFFEHDRRGAGIAAGILGRLRTSAGLSNAVTFLVRRHMRFEGLIQQPVPSDRARLRYLRATEPFSPEAILLSVSDRLSVRGRLVTEADVARHLALAREMMAQAFAEAEAEPLPKLITGDELMRELSLAPGPPVGRLLERIAEEQQLGNIRTRAEALALAAAALEDESWEDEPGDIPKN